VYERITYRVIRTDEAMKDAKLLPKIFNRCQFTVRTLRNCDCSAFSRRASAGQNRPRISEEMKMKKVVHQVVFLNLPILVPGVSS
jgi:hypothetical protein